MERERWKEREREDQKELLWVRVGKGEIHLFLKRAVLRGELKVCTIGKHFFFKRFQIHSTKMRS